MTQLVEDGWIGPAGAGPSRRIAVRIVAVAVVALLAWGAVIHQRTREVGDAKRITAVAIDVSDDGTSTITGAKVRVVRDERRTLDGAPWQALEFVLPPRGDRSRIDVKVALPGGVDPETTSMRVIAPGDRVRVRRTEDGPEVRLTERGGRNDVRILLVMPVNGLDDADSTGKLGAVTEPFDADRADSERATDRLDRARSRWWIVALVDLLLVVLLLFVWRRSAARWFSMRVPGAGTKVEAPPSSTDPVAAAVIAAGARDVDVADAFAGHVLDLVERQQLQMRRTLDPVLGAGARIGLAHADDSIGVAEDAAVLALRAVAVEGGLTVPLPDAVPKRLAAPPEHRAAWGDHVAARARFERLVEQADARRYAAATAAIGALALIGFGGALLAGEVGSRTLSLGVGAALVPLLLTMVLWTRDRAGWRRIVRERRNERAQWLAWMQLLDSTVQDGPVRDPRLVPLVVAVGRGERLGSVAGMDSVGLAAATRHTASALRDLVD